MLSNDKKLIAVIGAAGKQGGGVVRALQALAPQKQQDGTLGWALPIDPTVRGIHMGDITQLGDIVAGAFAHPDEAGNGAYLPLVGDFMSFNDIIETLNREGHEFSFMQVPTEAFATLFPGAAEVAATFSHFEAHTYLGSYSHDEIALAKRSRAGSQQNSRRGPERISRPGKLSRQRRHKRALWHVLNRRVSDIESLPRQRNLFRRGASGPHIRIAGRY